MSNYGMRIKLKGALDEVKANVVEALTTDESIGLLLPCNVVLKQEGDEIEVSILDPEAMFSMVEPETKRALAGLPQEAKNRLQAALSTLEGES